MLVDTASGFALGLSLILVIGAQNAFVIRQAIRNEHVFAVCLTCSIADAFLIFAGITGFGLVVERSSSVEAFVALCGAIFLIVYGLLSARSAYNNSKSMDTNFRASITKTRAIMTCLALAFLNPHVYLDTVLLLGSVSTNYEHNWMFGLGAALASFSFFFSIGYGSNFFAPLLRSHKAWRALDAIIAFTMISLALILLSKYFL